TDAGVRSGVSDPVESSTSFPTSDVRFLSRPPSVATALRVLPDAIAQWFVRRYNAPTLAQRLAWPAIDAGGHVLICAPTGGGKTLAAILPILGRLLAEPAVGLCCLYVAPLKALVRDLVKNVRRSTRDLGGAGRPTVAIRTGDTTQAVRRRQLANPPQMLATTPESLAVLLSQPSSRERLRGVRWVVVDEVHALASSRRGADLALSLERLADLTGERLQRIGLSATCSPLAEAARFLVGAGRACSVVSVPDRREFDLAIEPLSADDAFVQRGSFLKRLLDRIDRELVRQRTTLIFTNTRALAERVAWGLARRHSQRRGAIAVHHSSLAAAVRRRVERQLKRGALWAVVSSASLELGIDIGQVDGVVLVHPPGGVIRLLQRLGRSGHGPSGRRHGLVLTATPAELLEAAVTAAAARDGWLEALCLPAQPLDVLCQHLLAMAMGDAWLPREAFRLVRRAAPYRLLDEADFRRCLDYLFGRRTDGSAWLPARLRWDGEGRFTIASEAVARLLRRNFGTIVSDPTCGVRLLGNTDDQDRSTPVGTVDECFADRLQPGDRFLLGGRPLEYRRRGAGALWVREACGVVAPPRWESPVWRLPPELVRRIYAFRVAAAEWLREGPTALAEWLNAEYHLTSPAVDELIDFFSRQEQVSEVPGPETLLIEQVRHESGIEAALHTPLPRAANEALAQVLTWRLRRDHGRAAESLADDLLVLLYLRGREELDGAGWRRLLAKHDWDADLAAALRDSWSVRERFAETATTGMMLLRRPLGGPRKVGGRDWAQRRLFDQVRAADSQFVLLQQAERDVRQTTYAGDSAADYLARLPGMTIRCRWLAEASPMASLGRYVRPAAALALA
ncbi:MAG: DEAD/DEAH box helicase, partial [Gemmataceae bacterium]|nr:DEAD/DEAH box helicase [Gemmataceae bacterium]